MNLYCNLIREHTDYIIVKWLKRVNPLYKTYAKCQKVSLAGAAVFKKVTKMYDILLLKLKTQKKGLTVRITIQTGTKVGYIDLTYKCGIYVT
jgi:hypothetical protein